MSDYDDRQKLPESEGFFSGSGISRRDFFKYAGVSAAAATTLGLVGCNDDDEIGPGPGGEAVDLGSGDIGILNFAYALEQLEAAFYAEVVANPYGFQGNEDRIFNDLAEHEQTHRDWFKQVLGSDAIQGLTPTFDDAGVDFSDRSSVLNTAKALEDTGVGAYNQAGPLIQTPDYLVEAGKIVSVEARHAAAIRDLINPNSADFAGDDVVGLNGNGLEKMISVSDVLDAAGPFIEEDLDASNIGQ